MAQGIATPVRMLTFSSTTLNDYVNSDLDEILSEVNQEEYTWVHISSLHDLVTSRRILEHFGLPLSLAEQIDASILTGLDVGSKSYLLKQFRFISQTTASGKAAREPDFLIRRSETDRFEEFGGTVILGRNFLLLFEDGRAPRLIDKAWDEILSRKKNLQKGGIDYLLYYLIRTVMVDNYLLTFRRFMEQLHEAEDALLNGATDAAIYRNVAHLRRELNPFERSLLYADEFASLLSSEKPEVLSQASFSHLADNLVSDTNRMEKEFSILRDRTSELIQMYRDNVNAELNNILRILTVISTIFLPLSFITSFYGMNFPNIPAFMWSGSYPTVIAIMVALIAGSLIYARKKKWL